MDKTKKVYILTSFILAGFAFSVFYHYVLNAYMHLGEPFSSFLYPASSAFCDFNLILPFTKDFAPYHQVALWVAYFPLTYIILYPFYFIKPMFFSYLIFLSFFFSYFIFMNTKVFVCKNLTKIENIRNIFILTIMSYPFLYLVDKGNFDMFLFVIVGLCVYAFKNEKFMLSAVLLAVANAIKPFTILFLILFLMKKKYKEFFLSIILTAVLVIGGFLLFKNNFYVQLMYFIRSLIAYEGIYVSRIDHNWGLTHGSSLFMPIKLLLCKSAAKPFVNVDTLYSVYNCISWFLTAVTLFFVWREKSYWKQLTLLICNFLIFPCMTYDYKLIFLYIPLWLFVSSEEKSRFDLAYIVLFALMLIPKSFLIVNSSIDSKSEFFWFSISIFLNPIILIALSLLIIYDQIYSKRKLKESR